MSTTPKIDDGGPAFPCDSAKQFPTQEGMTLRDWFAGQALAGIMASDEDTVYDPEVAAKTAWGQADAIIRARQLPPST